MFFGMPFLEMVATIVFVEGFLGVRVPGFCPMVTVDIF